ncbi:unnamed protein product [Phytophthora fragariaefolia]|uniref:Unnamed protein product n=1 Tax=Phytophthora fragariaefolia TaxID=1490495 RepID=A0A9W6XT07_9STRA|nr:unnamed protein product [Phytophthora fragariaefolia]
MICPWPGLDRRTHAEPGSAREVNGASEPNCTSLGQGPRRYKQCLPGRHSDWRQPSRPCVLTRTDTGLQYQKIELKNPPTLSSELTSLPAMSWKRFARDLHGGRIEQICILSDVERMKCEAEELKQLVTEGADALSAKSKKECFDEQSWDSLKSSPLYEVLREYKDVLPDDIPAELPQDKSVQHEIDLVPGMKYCVSR